MKAFEAELVMARWRKWTEPERFPEQADRDIKAFLEARQPAWSAFFRNWDDWTRAGVVTLEDYSPDPAVDIHLNAAVLGSLGDYGFRRLKRSFKSEILPHPLVLTWDKGTWRRSMIFALKLQCFGLRFSPASAFFLSGVDISHSRLAKPGPRFREVFSAIGETFEPFLESIRVGLLAAEEAFRSGAA